MTRNAISHVVGILAVLFFCGSSLADGKKESSTSGSGDSGRTVAPAGSGVVSDPLHDWVVEAMVSWSPPGRSFIKDAKETRDEGKARYAEIADAMLRVAYDPSEPAAFRGPTGRGRTLALMLSIAWHESGFRRDVDLGIGSMARGDSGRSWCLIQAQLGSPGPDGKTPGRVLLGAGGTLTWTTASEVRRHPPASGLVDLGGEDLVADRRLCIRTGLRAARKSLTGCRSLPALERLAGLSGSCDRGRKESRSRMAKAIELVSRHPLPMKDADAISMLFPAQPEGDPARGKLVVVTDGP